MCELIDTLWNVNDIFLVVPFKFHNELIDTLWNVNVFIDVKFSAYVL